MIPLEAWTTFNYLLVALGALGGGAFALQRLGIIGRKSSPAPAAPAATPAGNTERLTALERRVASIETALPERYIARADWVPIASRMMGMLERNTETLARLDERTRHGRSDRD